MGFALISCATAQDKTKKNEAGPAQVVQIQKQIELLKTKKGTSPILRHPDPSGN